MTMAADAESEGVVPGEAVAGSPVEIGSTKGVIAPQGHLPRSVDTDEPQEDLIVSEEASGNDARAPSLKR